MRLKLIKARSYHAVGAFCGLFLLNFVFSGCVSETPGATIRRVRYPSSGTDFSRYRERTPAAPEVRDIPAGGMVEGRVVIDPGHGGKDPGALGTVNIPEKVVVLDIARKLAPLLEERGVDVVMTREGDQFISLDERAAMADRYRADLFVSIHADSSTNSYARGATLLIARNALQSSRRAAWCISKALARWDIVIRKTRRQKLRVLEGHNRPSVLVECGFMSNYEDAINLSDPQYQARIAGALAEGIAEFLSR